VDDADISFFIVISRDLWVCSAGLKNTVPANCCERKILFWQDVNSDSVRRKTSQPAGFKPAEHVDNLSLTN